MRDRRRAILLPFGFGVVIVLITAIALISVSTLRSNSRQAEALEKRNFEKIEAAEAMRAIILKRSHLLALAPTMVEFFDRDQAQQTFNALVRDFIVHREKLASLLENEDQLDLVRALRERNAQTSRYVQTAMAKAVERDPNVDLTPYMRQAFEVLATNRATLDTIIEAARAERARHVHRTAMENERIQIVIASLGVGGSLLGIVIAVLVIGRERAYQDRLLREIDDRQAAECDLRKAHDTLEERVLERTHQLREEVEERRQAERSLLQSEDALRRAKENAERASAVKSDFMANMSHELRSPLNAIIGFSETMKMGMFGPLGGTDGKYGEYVDDILDSSRHLLALINDILDLTVIESGQLALKEESLDPVELARGALAMMAHRAEAAGVALSLEGDAGAARLHADPLRVRQMMLNLLTNAVKFTPREGTVAVRLALADDGAIVMAVADTGPGLTVEEVEIARSKFGQVGGQSAKAREGVGLGLPIVESLMRLHGGTMTIDSTPGAGTVVILRFPPERTENPA